MPGMTLNDGSNTLSIYYFRRLIDLYNFNVAKSGGVDSVRDHNFSNDGSRIYVYWYVI